MPNFFTVTNQRIYEAFHGPKTIDTDFNMKLEQVKQADRNIYHLDQLLYRVPHYFHGIRDYYSTLCNIIDSTFEKDTSYYIYSSQITNIYKELFRLYEVYTANVQAYHNTTFDWMKMLEDVKQSIKERERLRLIHDHYDDKIENYVKRRNRHLEKNQQESASFIEAFERNNTKYKVAAENYMNQSSLAYQKMCNFLDYRSKLIVPIIFNIMQEERLFYSNANNLLLSLQEISERLQALESSESLLGGYDPSKYIRGKHLLENYTANIAHTTTMPTTTIVKETVNVPRNVKTEVNEESSFSISRPVEENVVVQTKTPHVAGIYKENEVIPSDIIEKKEVEEEEGEEEIVLQKNIRTASKKEIIEVDKNISRQPQRFVKESEREIELDKNITTVPSKTDLVTTTHPFKSEKFESYPSNLSVNMPLKTEHVLTGYTPESFKVEEEEDEGFLSAEEMPNSALENLQLKSSNVFVKEIKESEPNIQKHQQGANISAHSDTPTSRVKINLNEIKEIKDYKKQ